MQPLAHVGQGGHGVDERLVHEARMARHEAQARQAGNARQARKERREGMGRAEAAAVGIDGLAQKRHVLDAGGGEGLDLAADLLGRAAYFRAAHRGHDAIGAGQAAPAHDGHVGLGGPRVQGAAPRVGYAGLPGGHHGRGGPDPREQLGEPVKVARPAHQVDERELPEKLGAVLLGDAAGDRDQAAGAARLPTFVSAEVREETVLGVLPDGAGEKHDGVGVRDVLGADAAGPQEGLEPDLRVELVHLAAEDLRVDAARTLGVVRGRKQGVIRRAHASSISRADRAGSSAGTARAARLGAAAAVRYHHGSRVCEACPPDGFR